MNVAVRCPGRNRANDLERLEELLRAALVAKANQVTAETLQEQPPPDPCQG